MNDYNKLFEMGKEIDINRLKPIHMSKNSLSDTIFKLKNTGSTALGPALTVAVGMASQYQGSEVFQLEISLMI